MYTVWRYIFKRDFSKRAILDIGILKWSCQRKIFFIAKAWRRLIYYKYNIDIHINAKIGSSLKIPHPLGIVIGPGANIGENCTISQGVTIGGNLNNVGNQVIGCNTFIGAGAKILGNVTIGENCIVGANALITKNIPSNKVAAGYNKIIEKSPNDYLTKI